MAIEDLIAANTAALVALTAAIQANGGAAAVATPPAASGRSRAVGKLVAGDPEGTRYYTLMDKTVGKCLPGDEWPLGAVEINGDNYTKREKELAKNTPAAAAPAPAASAPAPAAGAPAAAPAVSSTNGAATTPSGPSWEDLTKKLTELSRAEGGREKVLTLFKKWGVTSWGKPVQDKNMSHVALMADIAEAINPPVAAPADDLASLGL